MSMYPSMGINVVFKYPTYVFMLGLNVLIHRTSFHSAGMEQEAPRAMSVFDQEGNKDEDGKGKNKGIENEEEASHQEGPADVFGG
jgi:hypothetical protein